MKIGIDLGGSHIGIGLVDDNKNIIKKYERDFTEEEKSNLIPIVEDFVVEKTDDLKNENEIESIGIAIPGAVKNGVIIRAVNLGINNFDITKSLNDKLNLPILVENDGRCACIAEYNNLAKRSEISKDAVVLFLNIGTGIGGGVIHNGKLLKGNSFAGCEFGHMTIKDDGIQCNCGKKGCFEKYGSILGYKNKVKQRLNIDQNINGDELRNIMDLRKDEFVDLQKQYVWDLSIGLSNLINIFEPDTIIIGGGFVHFSYMFLNDIKYNLLCRDLLFNKREDIDIRTAKLGNDAGIIGATCI